MISQNRPSVRCLVLMMSALFFCSALSAAQPTAPVSQHHAGFSAIDDIMNKAVADAVIPGGVVLIGHDGKVVYRKAFGSRSLEPTREAMTVDTVFDLASLTKCIATATSVMKLVEQGKVRVNDPVAVYLPEFGQNGKENITVRELLTHFSGLREDLDLKENWQGRAAAFRMAMQEKTVYPPGSRFLYSDINFETLGFLVERVSGESLNEYAEANIFEPLGMKDTRFVPPASWHARIAPTEYDESQHMLRGVVHDPTARRMGGVAGHAGLFSTADDLAKFAEDMLTGFKVLGLAAVQKMSTPQQPATASSLRGFGWDIDSPFASNRGELLPVGSFGHTGFTGTSLWIDPVTDSYIIILTNAVHPHGGKSTVSLRARIATATVRALDLTASESDRFRLSRITGYNESLMASRRFSVRNGDVQTGIDVLESHSFSALHPDPTRPVRVGLITNHTALDSQGRRTADVLANVPGVKLVAIFSPEHGMAGNLDTTDITNSRDAATGAAIFTVYGDSDAKRRPSLEVMKNLELVVFDIQDIGVRFYTYETTLGYFLEAAAKSGKEMIVLDRPNPIGGAYVQGPVADAGRESFTGYWQTPVRHGMTVGELAKMFNAERGINARLSVVPMEGWQRGDWYDSTGKLWINPSPNMRSLTEATLYPGVGLIEGTNISVGRGTDTPFELVGAPWVDAVEFAKYLNAREISGVRFVPVNFTPSVSMYANEKCGGVNIQLTDRNALDVPELGIEIAAALQALYPSRYQLVKLDGLILNKASLDALTEGQDPRRIAEAWRDQIEEFQKVRGKYLIY
jgi:uncharacterized protein YbbC (DUF1343 family)/CubicO group peptidase (beta-lactamase class C family)